MTTKLIPLAGGIWVEADVTSDSLERLSAGHREAIVAGLGQIEETLISVCRPISEALKRISEGVKVEEAEVEVGLSFEAEGNVYITKAKAGASLTVKLKLKPKE